MELTPNLPTSKQTWSGLSALVKAYLLGRAGLYEITDNPVLSDQLKAALPELRQSALNPASREEMMQILGRRFAIYPQPERSDGEWASWWSDYTETLKDIPAPALEAGMAAYVAMPDSEFFPKPGKLWALSKSTVNEAAVIYQRALHAASVSNQLRQMEEACVPKEPTPEEFAALEIAAKKLKEDQAAVRELAKGLANVLKAPEGQRAKPRPNYGKIDDTGITPELRKIMASK